MPSFRSPYGIKSIRKRTEKSLSKCAAPSSSASPVPTLTGKKSTTYCRRKEQILVDLIIQWWNLNLLWMRHSWIASPLTSEPHWCRMRIHVLLVFWQHGITSWYRRSRQTLFVFCKWVDYSFKDQFIHMSSVLLKLTKKQKQKTKQYARTIIKPLNSVTIWSFAAGWKVISNRKQLSGNDNQRGVEWLVLH